MAQFLLPTSDVTVPTSWTEGAGDGDGDVFDELDEGFGTGRGTGSGPDDATTYWVADPGAAETLVVRTGSATDPASSTDHHARWRYRKDSAGGRQIDFGPATLRDGDQTLIASTNPADTDISNTWATFDDLLAEIAADGIDDFSSFDLESRFAEVGGGQPKDGHLSAVEFELPDAGGVSDDTITIFVGSVPTWLFGMFAWLTERKNQVASQR